MLRGPERNVHAGGAFHPDAAFHTSSANQNPNLSQAAGNYSSSISPELATSPID